MLIYTLPKQYEADLPPLGAARTVGDESVSFPRDSNSNAEEIQALEAAKSEAFEREKNDLCPGCDVVLFWEVLRKLHQRGNASDNDAWSMSSEEEDAEQRVSSHHPSTYPLLPRDRLAIE